jgi:23S rRNA (uracil1939-C5)-methyltransferase
MQLDVDIIELTPGGDGLAMVGGRRTLIPFTIPGERVRVETRSGPADSGVASLVKVLRPSPHRIAPRCRHFGSGAEPGLGPCGGCSWQHIAYPEQLRLKTALVQRLLRNAVPSAPSPLPMLPSTPVESPWSYRQKVHFVFGSENRGRAARLTMGHYTRGSRRVIPVQECPVHDDRGNVLAFQIADGYRQQRIGAADSGGELSSVAIRCAHGTDEQTATIVSTHSSDKRLRAATRELMSARPDVSFHLNLHPRRDAFIFGAETRRLSGSARMRERVAGTSFLVSPTAFFQTNIAAAEILVRLVTAAVPPESRVLDLYAGAGLFALPLALAGHRVVAVEENRAAVADGEASARLNRVDPTRIRFVARRAEDVVATARGSDVVILDPPREGCASPVVDVVFGGLRPPIGVYVSCNPEALATDLAGIARHGYQVRSVQPVDMFPHTPHVEAVAVVTR